MNEARHIGKTVLEVALKSDINPKGYVVFLLSDNRDTVGKRIGCYTHLRQLVSQHPALKFCEIKESYDYFGQTIMRIRRVFVGSKERSEVL